MIAFSFSESTTTETTTTTTTSSKNQSPVSYFDTGLDPENELELFMNGKMDQVKQHQAKLAQVRKSDSILSSCIFYIRCNEYV